MFYAEITSEVYIADAIFEGVLDLATLAVTVIHCQKSTSIVRAFKGELE